ncbi:MAG: hypothetical protein H7099_08225 [Gemmatimonadaceae bacterium]|nr:hypothetical protein [Gemmatimonadaceae bacterium]
MRVTNIIGTAVIAATLVLCPALGAQPRPCSLLTTQDVTAIAGEASGTGYPDDSAGDADEFGARRWACAWGAGDGNVAIVVLKFPTVAAATQFMTDAPRSRRMIPADIRQLTSEPGVGQQAWWGVSPSSALLITRRNDSLLILARDGQVASASTLRAKMRLAMEAALTRAP